MPATTAPSGTYAGKTADQILNIMRSGGWTQEGVNAVYALRGLANPPTVPKELQGVAAFRGRSGALVDPGGKLINNSSLSSAAIPFLSQVTQEASDPYRVRSGISNLAGTVLNTVGSYVGGPVWQAFTGVADAANNALGNNDGTSYTDGRRSSGDRIGAAVGSIAGSMGGPGSYAANNPSPNNSGWGGIDEAGAGAQSGAGGFGNIFGGGNMGSSSSMGWQDWVNLAGQAYGAYAQYEGAKDAADASAAGSAAGIAEQRRQFDLSRADQMPWLASGVSALGRLNDPNAFTQSPGYEFVRGEGTRGLENSFSARGGAQSGNALRALTQYNQGLASQEYNNWFNQQSNLAGLGQTSAQSLGALGQNNANNVSNLLGQQANARASGIEGQTNALTGGVGDFLSWYNNRRTRGG